MGSTPAGRCRSRCGASRCGSTRPSARWSTACADPSREGRWITEEIADAYTELHALGWAHSIETWQDGELVGGLYGINVGGLFAGESMFHRVTDASKAAVVAMAGYVFADGDPRRLIDVQWATDHLRSLGVVTRVARATTSRGSSEAVELRAADLRCQVA